jgi:hypothetical protein
MIKYIIVSKISVLKRRCKKRKREYIHVLLSLFKIHSDRMNAEEGTIAVTKDSGKIIIASQEIWYSSAR